MTHILVVDDEKEIGTFLSHLFLEKGYDVDVVSCGSEFLKIELETCFYNLALIDLKLPDTNGLMILEKIKQHQPNCKVVIMTGYSTIETAVRAIKLGASDYIEKPFDDIDLLEEQVEQLLLKTPTGGEQHVTNLANEVGFIIGSNQKMVELAELAYKVANKNINVLIEGETGTGKEVLARFLHQASSRNYSSFIGVNCGALSESLLESELFGHEKGSFTGATKQRKGLFEVATNGTLFLDEVVEASSPIQVKLLRVLELKEFMRVGSEKVVKTNARIIAATNENLFEAVKQKKFREDLYYRLNVVHLVIPPLRERKEDIPLLLDYYLQRYPEVKLSFSDEAMDLLQQYSWPGNIRELTNFITRLVAIEETNEAIIGAEQLPLSIQPQKETLSSKTKSSVAEMSPNHKLKESIEKWMNKTLNKYEADEVNLEEILNELKGLETEVARAFINKALDKTYGNRKEASKHLHINLRKLRYLLNEKEK
ncbi:sigma-54-dependent transcriptional regulator [Alkalihalobacillus sp. 1P02AB]|uniref:sigma-54-dependent transcriptional regulator n=1 Tax=Alkalihalobacillus sp. 1P02AB TaxID=3132260 RepID=UPI0039A75CBF